MYEPDREGSESVATWAVLLELHYTTRAVFNKPPSYKPSNVQAFKLEA